MFDTKTLHLRTQIDISNVLFIIVPYSKKVLELYSKISKDVLIQQKLNNQIILIKILAEFEHSATRKFYCEVKTFFQIC